MAEPEQPRRTMSERFTLLLTNLGKLGGLVIGCREALGTARPSVLLFATAIYLGAQAFEDLVLKLIERNFGGR
jgi:hypothetical protein